MLSDALGAATGIGRATRAGPEIALEPGVLEALAEASLGAVVEVVPVAGGELLYVLVVAAAVGWSDWLLHRCTPAVTLPVQSGSPTYSRCAFRSRPAWLRSARSHG